MRIKNNEGETDQIDHCYDCDFKLNCNFLKQLKEISKGIQIIIIEYCSKGKDDL